ncbi:oxygen-dependent tRNA uridine(34) hydroxylase TrhO [Alcaligenes faecalis]|uniref:oxygen-dependent tRNA uridine(34) hydroxylase TrhO n=1 Tax=Alcaligenes faecalis TaxID=511 RepID=UPI001C9A5072|nr:rhodanese-related sulfurtransferase [Alcaligenes faecalis]MBY6310706.1 rhodanese-related sulfurtransferase [Alcaligenes faecalis]MBY6318583.1 rhodanese-related sulfurtransferase [Alcaligenes faecalis]MBY6392665.1 rhodanese-related sulfurtransferase [Alcaligenes faecalis]
MSTYLIAALYKFVELPDFAQMRDPLFAFCEQHEVKGTLLLAREGINGTIAGPQEGVRAVLAYLNSDPRISGLVHKESYADKAPFYRLKVKLKKEIVTLGVPDLKTAEMVGEYVAPEDWNALISDPDVVVVDTRNDYEVGIGTFNRAINPKTQSFTEFPQWVAEQSKEGGVLHGKPRVAMFCTGGIRCEKSTAFMRSQGFDQVYHLQGGILKYLEEIPAAESLWDGDCFVFDERVSVRHGLEPGDYDFCRACRMPISEEEKASPQFEEGVSCPYCHGHRSPEQVERFRERQKQVALAREREERHIGVSMDELAERREAARRKAEEQRLLAQQGKDA